MLKTPWKCTKNYNARAQLLFCSLNLLFGAVLIAVVVVAVVVVAVVVVAVVVVAVVVVVCLSSLLIDTEPTSYYFLRA